MDIIKGVYGSNKPIAITIYMIYTEKTYAKIRFMP